MWRALLLVLAVVATADALTCRQCFGSRVACGASQKNVTCQFMTPKCMIFENLDSGAVIQGCTSDCKEESERVGNRITTTTKCCPTDLCNTVDQQTATECPMMGLNILNMNAVRYPDGRKVGSRAVFTCRAGFVLQGKLFEICQSSGVWTSSSRSCRRIDTECPVIGWNTANMAGVSYPKGRNTGEQAVFACNAGFELKGKRFETCTGTGTWTQSTAKTCEPRAALASSCDEFIVTNGNVIYSSQERGAGSTAMISCATGHAIKGEAILECSAIGADLMWSGIVPTCEPVSCPTFPLQNGTVTYADSARRQGFELLLTCDENFKLEGPATRTCETTGAWSTEESRCVPQCAESPIENGKVVVKENGSVKSNRKLEVECNSGFRLKGAKKLECTDQGWMGDKNELPVCEPATGCPTLELENGKVEVVQDNGGMSDGSILSLSCNAGFELKGSMMLICQLNVWQGEDSSTPECQKVELCDDVVVANGRVDYTNGQRKDSMAMFTCNSGYELQGGFGSVRCDGKTWQGESGNCVESPECAPYSLLFGTVQYSDNLKKDSIATLSCNSDYALIGPSRVTCNGVSWQGGSSACVPAECEAMAPHHINVKNLEKVLFSDERKVGSQALYVCKEGAVLVGPKDDTCQRVGDKFKWIASPGPRICRVQCPPLESVLDETALGIGTKTYDDPNRYLGSTVEVYCEGGKVITNGASGKLKCSEESKWEGKAPQCAGVPKSCITCYNCGGSMENQLKLTKPCPADSRQCVKAISNKQGNQGDDGEDRIDRFCYPSCPATASIGYDSFDVKFECCDNEDDCNAAPTLLTHLRILLSLLLTWNL